MTSTTTYNYDHANRLVSVDGVTYTYDNNGNLLNDGTNTYTYDSANRLKTFSGQGVNATYTYSGLGDRLSQTVNGVTTNYTLDLNAGLTQVLSDGTKVYVYGNGRIAQVSATTEYFLGDALGSVRQLTNASGQVTLAKSYTPYGETRSSAGSGTSIYSYTGEQQDASGLTYLRARYYTSGTGRFLTRDTWGGDVNSPMSFNRWVYVEANPINRIDPTGLTPLQAGYVEGFSTASGVGDGDIDGVEIVYDYATMTRARFRYTGSVGGLFASIGAAVYLGGITGFGYEPKPLPIGLYSYPDLPYSKLIEKDYSGPFDGWYAGVSPIPVVGPKPNLTGGIGHFQSPNGSIKGNFSYLSLGIGLMPFEVVGFHTIYDIDSGSLPGYGGTGIEYYYDTKTRRVNVGKLISDILTGDHSPIPGGMLSDLTAWVGGSRSAQVARALNAANRFEKYYYQPQYGQCRDGQPDPQPLPPLPNPFPDPFHLPIP